MMDAVLAADAVSLACAYCTDADQSDWQWALNIPGVIAGASITLIAYLFRRRGEDKARARNLADSVRNEMAHILELLNDTTRTAVRTRPFSAVERIPTDIYDGLLNSAAISNFDADLQNELYIFYNLFRGRPVDEIQVSEKDLRERTVKVSETLSTYIHQKRPKLGFF